MANFVFLYTGGSMPQSDSERKLITEDWLKWYTKLGPAVVDGGNPFTPVAKSIHSDGRVVETPICTAASGYSVIKAESLNKAVELAKGCPVLKGGGEISVYETFPAM
jgi:hypothetical protein